MSMLAWYDVQPLSAWVATQIPADVPRGEARMLWSRYMAALFLELGANVRDIRFDEAGIPVAVKA